MIAFASQSPLLPLVAAPERTLLSDEAQSQHYAQANPWPGSEDRVALRGRGWVRSLSGVQSLLSVCLFAMRVLTQFTRLFDG